MLYDIIYKWNLKYNTNEPIYEQKQKQGHGEQTDGYQACMGWERIEVGV